MSANLRYYFSMNRVLRALVTGLGVFSLALLLAPAGVAQINGVPSSVTSIGFGGHPGPHGVPPSVTSIGPRGLVPNNQFPTQGIHQHVPSNPNGDGNHHHHGQNNNLGFGYGYAVPYAVPYYAEDPGAGPANADSSDDQYNGGPTVFDRRGSGQPAPYQMSHYAEPPLPSQAAELPDEPAANQPQTILVFKDGHHIEVSNYAIVGSMLYDMTPGHSRKVPLADLNLSATQQQNDNRGVDFQVPGSAGGN